jgi:hypothetical protein
MATTPRRQPRSRQRFKRSNSIPTRRAGSRRCTRSLDRPCRRRRGRAAQRQMRLRCAIGQRTAGRRRPPGVDNCAHARRLRPHICGSDPLDLQGMLPWLDRVPPPFAARTRLIIVRSLVRIQAELFRKAPQKAGVFQFQRAQRTAWSDVHGSVLEATAPLPPPDRQWSSCERRNQSLWPGASCSTGSCRAAVSLCRGLMLSPR